MTKQLNFLALFQKFISNSRSGKRLNKDGSKIKRQSIANYDSCEKLLLEFVSIKHFELLIYQVKGSNAREHIRLKKYHANFYKQFILFLYKEKNCHDNYVGQTIKQIRTFYGWLNNDQGIITGNYYKSFYVCKEDIPIITLSLKQLQFLAFDQSFEDTLTPCLKRCKDFFIFGCIVGLRFSDLISLRQSNIETRDNFHYLKVRSKKTSIDTFVKLPERAIQIINRYNKKKNHISIRKKTKLFPIISLDRFNTNVKKLAELAGWVELIHKIKTKSALKEKIQVQKTMRFCDALSSHTMRRTSITTMLTSGMPEYIVRKISGHTSDSKAFFRYVNLAQSLMDMEIKKMHKNFELAS